MTALDLDHFRPPSEGTRLALGFFDGFHLGHQALTEGADHAFTFRNHPSTVLDASRTPPLITDFEERVGRLSEAGLQVILRDFDRPFSQLAPRDFLEQVVVEGLGARVIRVGPNYRFGHKAAGNIEFLKEFGGEHDLEVQVVEPVEHGGELISSTRIRQLVQAGKVARAAELLGRPFEIRSVVEKGDARGRQLGFPTANLSVPPDLLKPSYGVYAVEAAIDGEAFLGVANFGVRPTVGEEKELLEVHLLDIERDLYGLRLQVKFRASIREERKFAGLDELQLRSRMTWPPPANFTVAPDTGEVRLGRVEAGFNDDLAYWEEQLRQAQAEGGLFVPLPSDDQSPFWLRLSEVCLQLGLEPRFV